MNAVYRFLDSITPENFNSRSFLQFAAVFALGMLIISLIGRIFFGKKSTLNRSVSCAISILCIYVVNVILYSVGTKLEAILSPLPFIEISGDYLLLFNVLDADVSTLCSHVLDMLILAFLVGLLDSWLPQGNRLFAWFGFRILSVVLGICLHFVINLLLAAILPESWITFAPTILIIVMIFAFLLSLLKLIIGGALAFLSPILAILYSFFFSNLIGKHLTKAILTTAILTGLVCLLNYLGINAVYIASAALAAYLPLLILVLILWYVISHLL